MKIVSFLSVLNQLQVFHWQTTKYSEHIAFETAHKNLSKLFDRFVEIYTGKYGRPTDKIEYTVSAISYTGTEDPKKFLNNKKRELIATLRGETLSEVDKDLLNVVDEIEGEFNRLSYLLDLN